MWIFVSFLVGTIFFTVISYLLHFVVGLRWDIMILGCIVYYMYVPHRNEWVCSWRFWSYFREKHLNITFHGNTDVLFDDKNPYSFGVHPHGTHCVGAILACSHPKLTHVRVGCTSVLFWIPVIKEFVGWGGAVPVKKQEMKRVLKSRDSLMVYPGAFTEMPGASFLRTEEENDRCKDDESLFVCNRRRGWIEVSKEMSTPIVPVWVKGEYELYTVYHFWPRFQKWFYGKTRYPGPFWSQGWFGSLFPKAHENLQVWIGNPIETSPDSDTDELHTAFYQQIEELKKTKLVVE